MIKVTRKFIKIQNYIKLPTDSCKIIKQLSIFNEEESNTKNRRR